MIRELADYLASETGLTLGTDADADFSTGEYPAVDEVVGVASRLTISGGPERLQVPGRSRMLAQMVTRSPDYVTSYDRALVFSAALRKRGEITLPLLTSGEQWAINSVEGMTHPFDLGSDAEGRNRVSVNYTLQVDSGL